MLICLFFITFLFKLIKKYINILYKKSFFFNYFVLLWYPNWLTPSGCYVFCSVGLTKIKTKPPPTLVIIWAICVFGEFFETKTMSSATVVIIWSRGVFGESVEK